MLDLTAAACCLRAAHGTRELDSAELYDLATGAVVLIAGGTVNGSTALLCHNHNSANTMPSNECGPVTKADLKAHLAALERRILEALERAETSLLTARS